MKSFFFIHLTIFLIFTFVISKAQSPRAKNTFTHIDSLRGTLSPLRSCYDINFYHLDVRFDIDKKFITGSNLFKFTVTDDFTKLQFDLFANLSIEKILYHGKEMKFTREARTIINDDKKWLDILRGLNREFYHQTVTYDQITGYISDHSGKNLKPVFDQYLRYKNLPVLEFATVNGQLSSRWITDAKDFNMPVSIKIKGEEYQFIIPSDKFTPVRIKGITKDNLVIDIANYYISVLLI